MGFTVRAKEQRMTLEELDRLILTGLDGVPSVTGRQIDGHTALSSAAVFACIRILAETVASLPLHVYRRLQPKGKERAPDHPLYDVLHSVANPEMTAMALRETMQGHLAAWGNAYAEIQWGDNGQVAGLWPLRPEPSRTEPVRFSDGSLWYRLQIDSQRLLLPAFRILHIPGFGFDGLRGHSIVSLARDSIGLAMATEEHGARLFGNGAVPKTVLEYPGRLSAEAEKNLQQSWEQRHQGLDKAHRLAILQEGMKIQQVGLNNEDSQFLATRQFQVAEIARWFRIPPHMIGDLQRSTNNNIEHQGLEFVQYTLMPWLVRWEQGVAFRCLSKTERKLYFVEHLVDGLQRGDMAARWAAYRVGREIGVLTANDVAERENLNPIPGGEQRYVPANWMPATAGAAGPVPSEPEGRTLPSVPAQTTTSGRRSAAGRRRLMEAHRPLFADAAARVIRRERAEVLRAAQKFLPRRSLAEFDAWLQEFYDQDQQAFIQRNMTPVFDAYARLVQAEAAEEVDAEAVMTAETEEFVRSYVRVFAARQAGSSLGQLRQVVRDADLAGEDTQAAVDARLQEWTEKGPDKVAWRETVELGSALAKLVWVLAGITLLRWHTSGSENCPYCQELDGAVVGVDKWFVAAGQSLQPQGADRPMVVNGNTGHPPLHAGCDCNILPETSGRAAALAWEERQQALVAALAEMRDRR